MFFNNNQLSFKKIRDNGVRRDKQGIKKDGKNKQTIKSYGTLQRYLHKNTIMRDLDNFKIKLEEFYKARYKYAYQEVAELYDKLIRSEEQYPVLAYIEFLRSLREFGYIAIELKNLIDELHEVIARLSELLIIVVKSNDVKESGSIRKLIGSCVAKKETLLAYYDELNQHMQADFTEPYCHDEKLAQLIDAQLTQENDGAYLVQWMSPWIEAFRAQNSTNSASNPFEQALAALPPLSGCKSSLRY